MRGLNISLVLAPNYQIFVSTGNFNESGILHIFYSLNINWVWGRSSQSLAILENYYKICIF